MLYWVLKRVLLGPLLRVLFRPRVEGLGHVPRYGPAILASNHLSFSDSIFLPLVLDRRITFPAKMEYFTDPSAVGRLKAFFFRGTGQIPIDRTGGQASRAAIDAGLEVLARGELFGIYPEGTRSPDAKLYKGKTGVARMALEANVPVVPVVVPVVPPAPAVAVPAPMMVFGAEALAEPAWRSRSLAASLCASTITFIYSRSKAAPLRPSSFDWMRWCFSSSEEGTLTPDDRATCSSWPCAWVWWSIIICANCFTSGSWAFCCASCPS